MNRVQNLTQAYSQAPWRIQMQIIGGFLLALVSIAIVAGIYLNVSARATTIGREIQGLQSDIRKLDREIADLQSQVAFLKSAAEMEKRAKEMGFRPIGMDETLFIRVPGYVERRTAVMAPAPGPVTLPPPSQPSEYTESLFAWLQRKIRNSSFPFMSLQPFKVQP